MKKTNAQNAATAAQTNAQNATTAAATTAATTAVKVSRKFTFKLYVLPKDAEFEADAHSGEFCYKSDCHYYTEKQMLDMLKRDELVRRDYKYAIYKISTTEDSKIPDMLIEVAYFNGEKIVVE